MQRALLACLFCLNAVIGAQSDLAKHVDNKSDFSLTTGRISNVLKVLLSRERKDNMYLRQKILEMNNLTSLKQELDTVKDENMELR
jgi:hypothetical protein